MRPSPRLSGWAIACLLVAALISLPVLRVLASLFQGFDDAWFHLVQTRMAGYATATALLAAATGVIAAATGVGTAWLVTMCRFPGRAVFRWALLLPLAVPAWLAAYAWTDLLQFAGPVRSWLRATPAVASLDGWFPEIRSLGGAAVILGFGLGPYVFLAARTAFQGQSGVAMELGRTLGRGPWGSFFHVALPMARPGIAAGLVLVLMETLADFGVADYFAVDTFATGVYRAWKSLESPTAAAQLASVLLGAVAVLVLAEGLARRRARHHAPTQRQAPLRPFRLGPLAASGAFLACALPVAVGFLGPALLFAHMTLAEGDERSREVLRTHAPRTLGLAAGAAALAVALALTVALGDRLRGSVLTGSARRVAGFGYALPGTVIAVGLLGPLAWIDLHLHRGAVRLFGTPTGLLLTGGVAAVVIGYQVRFLGVALAMIESGLGRVRRSVDDAARSLGAGGWRLTLVVLLPLLRAPLLAALLLVFVDVVKELPVTLMLRPFDFDTLAVRVYQLASDERLEEASSAALAIIGLGLLPVVVLSALLTRREERP
ncbi:ABC transporter permease [Phycisphaera mikurensis]|uniref:Putative iron ABC transporter permease protein n=1 Tax=Phycisphaera mikurensis (strain NBRC 102666 / KCTC 22515 / FYK2301M01) TaxID=1142394 RepID=I0IH93_PHYMF|nr:iron ABC transporter permease [Phycisphaera mikurensis]MBB6440880.1 iron(III) transport system permease protein [Phycisphaera mikurensis]BAM04631.1 putative iron ABC transporter permease protein [Phycisphaera mikurensis NBRC 102666]